MNNLSPTLNGNITNKIDLNFVSYKNFSLKDRKVFYWWFIFVYAFLFPLFSFPYISIPTAVINKIFSISFICLHCFFALIPPHSTEKRVIISIYPQWIWDEIFLQVKYPNSFLKFSYGKSRRCRVSSADAFSFSNFIMSQIHTRYGNNYEVLRKGTKEGNGEKRVDWIFF